jgi:hypothetical protein
MAANNFVLQFFVCVFVLCLCELVSFHAVELGQTSVILS